MGRVYDELRSSFLDLPGERAIIDVCVGRIADSCGFGVPRDNLLTSAERKGPEKMAEYRALKNTRSIDGLPGLDQNCP
jgi:hypothetical protein